MRRRRPAPWARAILADMIASPTPNPLVPAPGRVSPCLAARGAGQGDLIGTKPVPSAGSPRAADGRIKLAYVTSSMCRCAPSLQLVNILRHLDYDRFEVSLITLSPERAGDSLMGEVDCLPVRVHSFRLGRLAGLFWLRKRLAAVIGLIRPHLIHSCGWRSDLLVSKLDRSADWILTARNIPHMEYPLLFGRPLGAYVAGSHVGAIRKCPQIVCCAKAMQLEYQRRYRISDTTAIPDGVEIPRAYASRGSAKGGHGALQAVAVGALVARKNTRYLCEVFRRLAGLARLTVVGDGPEYAGLKRYASDGTALVGQQEDVYRYLVDSDFFVSASLSEGLPNAVLEALCMGLPCILSDIGPHRELRDAMPPGAVHLFSLSDDPGVVAGQLPGYLEGALAVSREAIAARARETFSAGKMSECYQALYAERFAWLCGRRS